MSDVGRIEPGVWYKLSLYVRLDEGQQRDATGPEFARAVTGVLFEAGAKASVDAPRLIRCPGLDAGEDTTPGSKRTLNAGKDR